MPYETEQRVQAAIGRWLADAGTELAAQFRDLCAVVGFITIVALCLFGPALLASP